MLHELWVVNCSTVRMHAICNVIKAETINKTNAVLRYIKMHVFHPSLNKCSCWDLSVIFLLLSLYSVYDEHYTLSTCKVWPKKRERNMSDEMFYATNKRELEPMKIKLMACCCVNHSHRVHADDYDVENNYIVDEKPKIGGQWVTQSGHKKLTFWCILMFFNFSFSAVVVSWPAWAHTIISSMIFKLRVMCTLFEFFIAHLYFGPRYTFSLSFIFLSFVWLSLLSIFYEKREILFLLSA